MSSKPPTAFCLVMTACGSQEDAKSMARHLVEEHLAACVNYLPMHSIYRWQGKVQAEDEWLLLIKTQLQLAAKIQNRIKALHSYEVPEIIVLPIQEGEADYLNWLVASTQSSPPA